MPIGNFIPNSTAIQLLVIVIAGGLIWVGSGWLEDSAENLSTYYGLPPVVQGSIIVAIGSSFPELASVVITALSGSFSMGVGAIVGSAIFNILVIPALSTIFSEGPLDSSRTIVYKEAQFYMIAVATLLITFSLGVIYNPVRNTELLVGEITRPLAVIPLFMYGLYIFIQWQDVSDHDVANKTIDGSIIYQWGLLLAGLLSILIAVEGLVGAVKGLNETFGIPEFISGVIILSAVTSIPDSIVSIQVARDGKASTSVANVLGSNTFDLLVAIPIGILIVGSTAVSYSIAAPMMGVLTLGTVLLFITLRTSMQISKTESYILLASYSLFALWIVSETIGYTSLIKTT